MASYPSNSLESFAGTAEAVAATTKKLEKARLLGEYFEQLHDEDLARAARFFAGQQFAQSDARTTNVGGSILSEAMCLATGVAPETLGPRYARWGDAGDVAFEIFVEAKANNQPGLALADAETLLSKLSSTRGKKAKTELLAKVFTKATPLEAKYLVKLLAGDLRIGLREGLVEDTIARAFKQPLAEVSMANMLRGDIGEAAVRARAGALHKIEMRLFHPLKFMLATPASDLTDIERTMPHDFLVEDKFDGIRGQAHVQSGRVAIYSRTLDEISIRFPELHEPLAALPTDVILDGEIISARGPEILPFSDLQKRLGRKVVSEELLATTPVVFVAWDLLYAGGKVLIDDPLQARRARLEDLITSATGGERLRLSKSKRFSSVKELDDEFDAARARGNEGLMIKDPASFYKPGRRGREWLKLKKALATLDVVVTTVELGHGKRRSVLSDYTFAVRRSETEPELLNIGKAYSGLTDAEIAEMTEWFRAHTIQEFAHGRVRVVEPRIVIEVTFDRVQPSNRHKGGYALRFPRIVRLRPDKNVDEIDTLETVRRLANLA
ncbi:MAG TPA: ATP-dependent DNA ligase [Pyrinomonadaceae bacterium]|jgi:DNA ligase-1|nr:ATP-dependent DNA ligase [Pyrinomonadaceae bacterium]